MKHSIAARIVIFPFWILFRLKNLLNLQNNEEAYVSGGSSKRLADYGFVEGVKLTMVRCGKTCLIHIDDRLVALGFKYQKAILLKKS